MVIGFAVMAFTFQFTGTVGTAVFGSYWTPIYNFGVDVFGPVGKSLDAASQQINYAMCTITAGPGVCDALINPPSTAEGSTQALELSNFEAVNYRSGTPEIDPSLPLIGNIQLENQGDFSASNVLVTLKQPIIFDAAKASLNDPTASQKNLVSDICSFDSCLGGKINSDKKSCSWDSASLPKDLKLLTFRCGGKANEHKSWQSSEMNLCECRDLRNGKLMGSIG